MGQAAPRPTVAQPGGGQLGITVGFDGSETLRVAVCGQTPCELARGTPLGIPPKLKARAEFAVLPIGTGRHAVHVRAVDPKDGRAWEAVVAAPLTGTSPKVLFSGDTGLVEGEYGLRHGPMVMLSEPEADGSLRVVIGEQREDTTICGRPSVLAPQILAPSDLELHPAKVQRLTPSERARAERITARRAADSSGNPPRLLRAVAASSAVGSPGALTDGDLETTWAENRGGDGRGEFVVMQSAPELPIQSFEVVIRPPRAQIEHGVAPKDFWLATPKTLLRVTLPEDAWQKPGARYEIPLATALSTDCVALVVDSAYGADRDAQVTFAELGARSELDAATPAALAAKLAGGGTRAEAAAAVLRSLGAPGYAATAQQFEKLDEAGRSTALDVLDQAPCETSAPVYARALGAGSPGQRHHASTRLARCGQAAADALETALRRAGPKERTLLADQLALAAPERAVRALLPLFESPNQEERRSLRVTWARAAASPRARSAVSATLEDRTLPEPVQVDLLRALGPGLAAFAREVEPTVARLAAPNASFRTRFLLLQSAAALAPQSATARAFIVRSMRSDTKPELRAEAARVVTDPLLFREDLRASLGDPGVRVREAALSSLAKPGGAFAVPDVVRRLDGDAWPLVRRAAAEALAPVGPSAAADRALLKALADPSSLVRVGAAASIGQRGTGGATRALRDRLVDDEEVLAVRVAAATALGRVCAREAVDDLARYSRLLVDPTAGERRSLGSSAVAALGRIHPPDLGTRLAALTNPKAPPAARAAVRAALSRREHCPAR
jgi:hypothetical protein